jgi:hypothetical protein
MRRLSRLYAQAVHRLHARGAIIDPVLRTVVGHLPVGETPDGVAYTTRVVAKGAARR